MTQKEKSLSLGRDIDSWYNYIIEKMNGRKYISTDEGELWFLKNKGGAFHICVFESPLYGFIIEHAKSTEEADLQMAIDGRSWPLLDYDTPEDMLRVMLREIEG